jgi:hypothetical protein
VEQIYKPFLKRFLVKMDFYLKTDITPTLQNRSNL